MCGRVRVVSECRPLGVLLPSAGVRLPSFGVLMSAAALGGFWLVKWRAVSFRRRSCRSSALFGLVAACVASCRVFLSLSARWSGRVKMSLVGLISALCPSAGRVGVSL